MGDAGPPRVYRGGWSFDETGQFGQSPKIVNDLVAKPLHGPVMCDYRNLVNRSCCEIQDCGNEPSCVLKDMDVATLKALMEEHGENQAGLARLLGISPDKMSKTLSGKRTLKLTEANILRRYFGLDEPENATALLPIVGLVSAGSWQEGFERVIGHMPSPDKSLSADSFVVIVEGDSMDLVAKHGEGIIIDPRDKDLISGRYYVVRNGDGETTFKQYRDNPARLEPCSTNGVHQAIFPGRDDFIVVGRARKRVSDL